MRTPQPLTLSQRRRTFLIRPAYVLGLLFFAPLLTPLATANEVYAYLGDNFTFATFPYVTSDYISGDFTTSTILGPNLTDYPITPQTYSFSDGVFDWTQTNTTIDTFPRSAHLTQFLVTTDGYGTLESATFELFQIIDKAPWSTIGSTQIGELMVGPTGDYASFAPSTGITSFAINNTPGLWGPDFDPPGGVPEPATGFLTLTALLAAAFRARTRIAQGLRPSAPTHQC
ncbi:exported hypothetical protein [Candidatus Sulfopaludibacter sp. SbA3]|nr:exported hypothetical protein [Candidatus Sulfopaludibacter sp. SbA3]